MGPFERKIKVGWIFGVRLQGDNGKGNNILWSPIFVFLIDLFTAEPPKHTSTQRFIPLFKMLGFAVNGAANDWLIIPLEITREILRSLAPTKLVEHEFCINSGETPTTNPPAKQAMPEGSSV